MIVLFFQRADGRNAGINKLNLLKSFTFKLVHYCQHTF